MKSNFTLQLFFLLLFFLATPCILLGENPNTPELDKEKVKKASEVKDADLEKDDKPSEKEAKPHPEAEFAERMKSFEKIVKAEVYATKLTSGKKTQLQAMVVEAYRQNKLKPLWADSVDVADVNKALVKLLELHAFEEPVLTFTPKPDPSYSEEKPVSHDDLLVTLSVAETSLLLKQGPDSVSEWPNWSFGDDPAIESTNAHWNNITERFGKAAAGSKSPQKVAKAFVPQNRIYQQIFKEMRNADPAAEAPELTVTKLVKVGRKFEQAPELAKFMVGEGYLAEERVIDEPVEESAEEEAEREDETAESNSSPEESEDDVEKSEEEEEEIKPGINEGIYTKELSDAVKDFQKMNGLQADGILGPKTAERISDSDEEEAKALLINLHRARRFPDNPGETFLHANIPSGEVYGFSAGEETIRMRIVFGKNKLGQRTPVFRDKMEQVVFRPYWNLPYSIAVGEGNYSNTDYLSRNGFQIISNTGRQLPLTVNSLEMVRSRKSFIRQEGGTNNALGNVKFLFPNKHAVYFHDTPYKHYFKNSYRAQSHGCVRLEKPEEMANWVLSNYEEWDSGKISSAIKGKRQEVNLYKTIPVYITYFTALPDATKDDKIGFYKDIYNYDRPDAIVDAPGPRPNPIALSVPEPEKPTSIFSLFRRKDKEKSDSSRSTAAPTSRRASPFSKTRR